MSTEFKIESQFFCDSYKTSILWIVGSNDKVPKQNNDPPELLELLIPKHWRIWQDILQKYKQSKSMADIKNIYLYVSNNDKVPNDNNDPPELLELLLSKHWRMSDWSKAVIKVETSLPEEFLTIFLDSHFLALLAQMFEEAELKPIHSCKKSRFLLW